MAHVDVRPVRRWCLVPDVRHLHCSCICSLLAQWACSRGSHYLLHLKRENPHSVSFHDLISFLIFMKPNWPRKQIELLARPPVPGMFRRCWQTERGTLTHKIRCWSVGLTDPPSLKKKLLEKLRQNTTGSRSWKLALVGNRKRKLDAGTFEHY